MSSSTLAPNDQAAADMQVARNRTRVNVSATRDYLFGERNNVVEVGDRLTKSPVGGRAGWETHKAIVEAMRSDPVFDKSERCVFSL